MMVEVPEDELLRLDLGGDGDGHPRVVDQDVDRPAARLDDYGEP
jgi:hypothetical protein